MRETAGPQIAAGDRVVVTGAAGFIGSAVARAVLARGAHVVAAVEPGSDERNLDDLGPEASVERRTVDLRDAANVRDLCEGARFVFHLAAIYAFWARDPRLFADVNVGGTLNVLAAVRDAGCERMVYTSTVGVLGVDGTADGRPSDETSYADVAHLFGSYKRTKYVAEHEVLRAAAEGVPLSIVLPTFPLGPGDRRPTPTGKLVVDFLNGRMPAFVDTAMNVVHVDDLAVGHLAALERGGAGRSFILGGENRSMRSILEALAECTGLRAPTRQVPKTIALAAGVASQVVEGRLLRREPNVSIEAARMSTTHMVFDDSRARTEIGYTSRPARDAIEDSARWFVDHGYVGDQRRARISWVK
ncbi:MAG TPA: NAD-dependent epimerase/dehydratase family protein [Acidimicrobiia bacterium]